MNGDSLVNVQSTNIITFMDQDPCWPQLANSFCLATSVRQSHESEGLGVTCAGYVDCFGLHSWRCTLSKLISTSSNALKLKATGLERSIRTLKWAHNNVCCLKDYFVGNIT